MSILDLEVIKKFALTCNDGYEQGWHEGNGGNLSYRMTAEEVEACKPYFTYDRPWVDLGVQADLHAELFHLPAVPRQKVAELTLIALG